MKIMEFIYDVDIKLVSMSAENSGRMISGLIERLSFPNPISVGSRITLPILDDAGNVLDHIGADVVELDNIPNYRDRKGNSVIYAVNRNVSDIDFDSYSERLTDQYTGLSDTE